MIITIRPGQSRRRVHAVIDALDADKAWDVDIKPAETRRSVLLNRLLFRWHNLVIQHIGAAGGGWHETWTLHDLVARRLLPVHHDVIDGEEIEYRTHTSKLSVREFIEFLYRYADMAEERWGVKLEWPPDDLYQEMISKYGRENV